MFWDVRIFSGTFQNNPEHSWASLNIGKRKGKVVLSDDRRCSGMFQNIPEHSWTSQNIIKRKGGSMSRDGCYELPSPPPCSRPGGLRQSRHMLQRLRAAQDDTAQLRVDAQVEPD